MSAKPTKKNQISSSRIISSLVNQGTFKHLPSSRLRQHEAEANAARHVKVLKQYKIRMIGSSDGEHKVRVKQLGWFMINPQSTLYQVWQLTTLLLIIYQAISLPYGLAFGSNTTNWFENTINVVFGLDLLVQLNLPIVPEDEDQDVIIDRCEIVKHYSKGWLFFDLITCIPYDSLTVLMDSSFAKGENFNALKLLKVLRVPRLLRLFRLLRVLRILRIQPELRRWLQYSRHANLLRLVRLVAIFICMNHFLTCVWYGVIVSEIIKQQLTKSSSLYTYIISYHNILLIGTGQSTLTMTSDAEYLFSIFVMLLGSASMAIVFSNISMLISNYYESESEYQKKMEFLFASMNKMKLPNDLQKRINDYYQTMWTRHGTLDGAIDAFIPELSRNLAYEVELFLRMDMIHRAPIFLNCSPKAVQELVMELRLEVFMPGDYIVIQGEVGNHMYFVQNGICEATVETTDENVKSCTSQSVHELFLKKFKEGDYFGEIALLMNCKRTANVRAQVFSELCTLTREVFETVLGRFLDDRHIIEKYIMNKYQKFALPNLDKLHAYDTAMVNPTHYQRESSADPTDLLRQINDKLDRIEIQLKQRK